MAVCSLADGTEASDVQLIWTKANSNVARVSATGMVFGFSPGKTEVSAGDDSVMAEDTAVVTVVEGQGRAGGNNEGRGFPKVLVSGDFDPDPDTGEHVHFSSEDPPVWRRVQDVERNIWWINSSAPLARLYLDKSHNYGYETREWRMYHLERYIDVIVQIALSHEAPDVGSMPANEWILAWGSKVAQIQSAAAADLSDFIATGKLPGE